MQHVRKGRPDLFLGREYGGGSLLYVRGEAPFPMKMPPLPSVKWTACPSECPPSVSLVFFYL